MDSKQQKTLSCECKWCGETDPEKFRYKRRSKCYKCQKAYNKSHYDRVKTTKLMGYYSLKTADQELITKRIKLGMIGARMILNGLSEKKHPNVFNYWLRSKNDRLFPTDLRNEYRNNIITHYG